MRLSCLFSLATLFLAAGAAPSCSKTGSPAVKLDQGTFYGTTDGVSDAFLGIKFASAPRFELPIPVGPYTGKQYANVSGPICPQQGSPPSSAWSINITFIEEAAAAFNISLAEIAALANSTSTGAALPTSEDCLNLNVWTPAGLSSLARLPVVVWIYGGGFQTGDIASFNGGVIVEQSIKLKEPVVYVAMNYRLSAFGWLASKEVEAAGAGNIGLEDQRTALRWVQKYITAFGGDPNRVTIWGESAGAISVSMHLLANGGNTEGLFHGAFMQSGGPVPVGDITNGQPIYDSIVSAASCSAASNTLECLKKAPFETIQTAMDNTPGILSLESLHLTWTPRVDKRFLVDTPQNLVLKGSIAKVPIVTGNCEDEGTMWSLGNLEAAYTDSLFQAYILGNYYPGATLKDTGDLFSTLYPNNDPSQGSPFNTGTEFNFLQYKRLAAIQGDIYFQAPRRLLLDNTYNKQPSWNFLSKRAEGYPPFMGVAHGSDIGVAYGPSDMTDYLIHFVNHGNPNGAGAAGHLIHWPTYDTRNRYQLQFLQSDYSQVLSADTYRADGFTKLTDLSIKFPM